MKNKSPLRWLLLSLIRLYQKFISPWLGSNCRFYPSCSQYARMAFSYLPLHRAFLLSTWRILRCQPLSKGGEDYPAGISKQQIEEFEQGIQYHKDC